MATQKHILIVGGGVIGLCTAYYARQKGHRVTLLERGKAGDTNCSYGNAGMIVPSHFVPLAAPGMIAYGLRMMRDSRSPFYIKPRLNANLLDWGWKFARAANAAHVARAAPLLRDLNLRSRAAYEELAGTIGKGFGLTREGLLMLCKTDAALHEEAQMAEQANALGIPAEVLTPAQASERDPNVRMDIAGAVYFPLDCHLSPHRFVAGLTDEAKKNGTKIHYESDVQQWRVETNRVVALRTDDGREFTADEFVLAGGSWSQGLAQDLGLRLPVQAGKGYSVTLPHPHHLPRVCSILVEARVAVTPMGDSLRVGGTMEIAGLDTRVNRSRVEGIINAMPRYFPDFAASDFADLPVWSGLRPCSPDGLPYVGRFAKWANLSAATGHAMMGLSLGPITGKLMAEVLSDEPPSLPLALLSPDRYA